MDSKSSAKMLSHEPDMLTDADLLNISLSMLSKNLDTRLSHKAAVFVYLRWLEVQRVSHSNFTDQWDNTVLKWCQALRHRGLEEKALADEVTTWSKGKSISGQWGRQLPTQVDIAKAYMNKEKGRRNPPFNAQNHKFKDLAFDDLPPGDYTCHRCGERGHFLQFCPTNLDPAFDKPPTVDYKCGVCNQRGIHFKSLCPWNTDPLCINQRRKAQAAARREKAVMSINGASANNRESDPYTMKRFKKSTSDTNFVADRSEPQAVKNPDEIDIDKEQYAQDKTHAYAKWTRRLVDKYGDTMMAKVNQVKGRKTALEMWNEIDETTHWRDTARDPEEGSHYVATEDNSGRLTPYWEESMDYTDG